MVLVPADVQNTVKQLPRLTSNTSTIKATLKLRLGYKNHVYCLNIRPQLVKSSAKYLSRSSLYKEHVTFDEQWNIDDISNETTDSEQVEEPSTETNTVSQSGGRD